MHRQRYVSTIVAKAVSRTFLRSVDNITHTLAGLLLANAIVHYRATRIPGLAADVRTDFAQTAAVTGVIGANLPDADVPWHWVLQGLGIYDDLQLLLHHRGWTHTLLGAAIWIPLLAGTALLWRRWQSRRSGARADLTGEFQCLVTLSALAVLSHILLDFTNDYGVHPLSPFSNRWFYGDTVFIIEPWLWAVAVPALLRSTAHRALRVALGAVLAFGAALSWIAPQMSFAAMVVAAIGTIVALVLMPRCSPGQATAAGIGGWILVTLCLAAGTGAVRARVLAAAPINGATRPAAEERYRRFDVIVSPSPSNPFCARAITVDANETQYRLTTAWVAAAPTLISAAWCERAAHTDTATGAFHIPMQRAIAAESPGIKWGWSWTAPRAELATLTSGQCQIAAWVRFARAPFWVRTGIDSVTVGDLRYDRDRGMRVSRFTFPRRARRCPAAVPPWARPRRDIWPEPSS